MSAGRGRTPSSVCGVRRGDQRVGQLPGFGRRDDRGLRTVDDDLALGVPVNVLPPDDGDHDVGLWPRSAVQGWIS